MNQPQQSELEQSLDLLGAEPNQGWDDIEKQYRQLVQRWHPDRNAGDQRNAAESKFIEINAAYKHIRSHYLQHGSIPHRVPAASPVQLKAPEQAGPLLGTKNHSVDKLAFYKNKFVIAGTVTLIVCLLFGALLWSLDSRLTENNRGRATAGKLKSELDRKSAADKSKSAAENEILQTSANEER